MAHMIGNPAEIQLHDNNSETSAARLHAEHQKASRTHGPLALLGAFLALALLVANVGLSARVLQLVKDTDSGPSLAPLAPQVVVGAPASGLPGFETLSWETITDMARGQTLNFYLWSPTGTGPRYWIDKVPNGLAEKLQTKFGITLNRIDAVYSGCPKTNMKLPCDVAAEVAAGKRTAGGMVDLVWINGQNFRVMKEEKLLYGPWANLIPNAANFDWTNTAITVDKGIPTEGMELPFNLAQFVFIYNKALVTTPPKTVGGLVAWVKAQPQRFTYSNPSTSFTGAAFVRHFFLHYSPVRLDGPFDEAKYQQAASIVWAKLNEIEPFLYKKSGQPYYPAAHDDIRDLVGSQVLWLDVSFQESEASARIKDAVNPWPQTMQAYVLDSGTIADTNYLAIPVNAPNKAAALVAANYIAGPSQMFRRAQPEIWGASQCFDPNADAIKMWDTAFDYIARHAATPTVEELAKGRLADLHADYVQRINQDWVTFVLNA